MGNRRVILTAHVPGLGEVIEKYPQPVRHPDDTRRRSRRDRYPRVTLQTDDEAEEWGRALLEAFNAGEPIEGHRTFIRCHLEPTHEPS